MKARFFYAAACYRTWPKLYVLTEDGKLFSRYLDYMQPTTDSQSVNYNTFKASDYSYEGYQGLKEIDYQTAISKTLTRQPNWVESYINSRTN